MFRHIHSKGTSMFNEVPFSLCANISISAKTIKLTCFETIC